MEATNVDHICNNQRFLWASYALNRWLSMKLEFLGGLVILSAGCFAVLQREQLGAALLGLTLSQTFAVTGLLSLLNRLFADLENAFTSVERMKEYQEVDQEPLVGSVKPPPMWPTQGCITFQVPCPGGPRVLKAWTALCRVRACAGGGKRCPQGK